jgi:hypothetical protein
LEIKKSGAFVVDHHDHHYSRSQTRLSDYQAKDGSVLPGSGLSSPTSHHAKAALGLGLTEEKLVDPKKLSGSRSSAVSEAPAVDSIASGQTSWVGKQAMPDSRHAAKASSSAVSFSSRQLAKARESAMLVQEEEEDDTEMSAKTRQGKPWSKSKKSKRKSRHNAAFNEHLRCGQLAFIPTGRCPEDCPFFRPEVTYDAAKYCKFRCVKAAECGEHNSGDDVADNDTLMCRPGHSVGCGEFKGDGTDTCVKCSTGFNLDSATGNCVSNTIYVYYVVLALAGCTVVAAVLGFLYVLCLPDINQEVLDATIAQREAIKLRDESKDDSPQFSYLDDVHTDENIGGRGCVLHFDYQAVVGIWAFAVIFAWCSYVNLVDIRAFHIGIGNMDHPVERCRLVQEGSEVREDFAYAKMQFAGLLYFGSFVSALMFAYRQHLKCERMDAEKQSLMDFAVRLDGFPVEMGKADMEKEYIDFLKSVLPSCPVVGVSIPWDRTVMVEDVGALIEAEEYERFATLEATMNLPADAPQSEPPPATDPAAAEKLLLELPNCGVVFAIFKTEDDHSKCVQLFNGPDSPQFRGNIKIDAKPARCEPWGLIWTSFGSLRPGDWERYQRGMCQIGAVVVIWAIVIYLPYAWFTYNMYAMTGDAPGTASALILTVLVVGGNVSVYTVCDLTADWCMMDTLDERNSVYVLTYTLACFVNMILDLGIVVLTIYAGLCFKKVRDEDGGLVSEMGTWEDVMESFPMQVAIGKELFNYNVFGCFLVPFFAEPIATIGAPYFLGSLYIKKFPVSFKDAVQGFLTPMPMDLGRYADHLMNHMLAIMSLFVASGHVLKTFMGLFASFQFCYWYDRIRVTKFAEHFNYPTEVTDSFAQAMLSLPTALCGMVFTYQLRHLGMFGLGENWTGILLFTALVTHITIHLQALQIVRGYADDAAQELEHCVKLPYEQVAQEEPNDWFVGNKVHCLREKYVLKMKEPTLMLAPGMAWGSLKKLGRPLVGKVAKNAAPPAEEPSKP